MTINRNARFMAALSCIEKRFIAINVAAAAHKKSRGGAWHLRHFNVMR
jgi:hypothetical protein